MASHPDALEAHLALQETQLALGREQELLDAYRTAAKAAGADANAHYLYARLLRGAPAVTEYRAALRADANHFRALCGLAIELTSSRSFKDAGEVLAKARALDPRSAVPVNATGRLLEAQGRAEDAEKSYRTAIELAPRMVIARVNLGMLLVGAGRLDDAKAVLAEAEKVAPKDPSPVMALGMLQLAAKEPKEAAKTFQRAAALDPNSIVSLNLLGSTYVRLQQLELAEQTLSQALARASRSVATILNFALLRIAQNRPEEAAKLAERAGEIDARSADARYVQGLALDRMGEVRRAETAYHKATKLDDTSPIYVRALAVLYRSQGKWRDAITAYQKVVQLSGNSTESLMDLARAYRRADKPKQAAQVYDQVLAVEPTHLDAWLQLGIVYHRETRDEKRALRTFREYVNRGGTDPRVPRWIQALQGK